MLLIVASAAYGLSADFRGWVNARAVALRKQFEELVLPQYAPVAPVAITTTSELPGHPGGAALDGFSNTYWAAAKDGPEPTLVLRFDRTVTLAKAIVRPGARDSFQSTHRPQRLHLVFSTGKTADLELKDNPEPQELEIADAEGVTSVEVHVTGLFQSVKGTEVALSEIEFFEEK
ncbi:discoidin domain-containing protein [Actinokineospora auranticolor]|uniref:discoidin domain-containing protein n=1 Tax=Actinokineospora auranticolor TaxID=155976 RepID=UPI0011B04078|nr:discoidin domain-containing protein [Actinokineospora auranticolor]